MAQILALITSSLIAKFQFQSIVTSGSYGGGWISQYADDKQFLQIDLGKVAKVTRIAHQGRADAGWWTKSYTLSFSNDGATFTSYKNSEVHKCELNFISPVSLFPFLVSGNLPVTTNDIAQCK